MNIHDLGAVALANQIARGAIGAEEATRATLARIERLQPALHAYVTVDTQRALAEARAVDEEVARGVCRGPLHGVPIAIKDLIAIRDVPTGAGTVFRDQAASADATVVARLRQAGAIIVGSVILTEGAQLHHHPDIARPVNPWHEDLWTGASSSGSGVAVAAGLCHGALGTDTGGSIRMPSACCAITGIKPTWGRVSRDGLFPLAPSFDHIGPMARSVEDAAAILQVIAGRDPADSTSASAPVPDYLAALGKGVSGLRIGVDWSTLADGVAPVNVAAIREALAILEKAGAIIRRVALPDFGAAVSEIVLALSAETTLDFAAAFDGRHEETGPVLRETLDRTKGLTAAMAARGHLARLAFRQQLTDAMADVEVLVVPVLGGGVPDWSTVEDMSTDIGRLNRDLSRFLIPLDATGHPTLNLPAGFDPDGRPSSVQFVAAHFAEEALIRVGHAFQRATDHHLQRPNLDWAL